MDQSLDTIIASKKKGRDRRNLGRAAREARSRVLGPKTSQAPGPVTRARTNAATAVKTTPTASATVTDKIVVSNLPQDVNEAQIRELFTSTVGPLREVTLHYDAGGRSKGVATVNFSRKGDGAMAYQQYNNRLIDGKRPMKIEIVVDPSKPPPPASLASRVAPPPKAQATTAATTPATTRATRVGRGRGRGKPRNQRLPKTAADLDAEMEDYTATNTTAAAAPVVA